jgi:cardiolipin synthase A/B
MFTAFFVLLHIAGLGTAFFLLIDGHHQSRGALAWVIALIGIPWLALPLYWTSGRVRFGDYGQSQQQIREQLQEQGFISEPGTDWASADESNVTDSANENLERMQGEQRALSRLGILPTTHQNSVELITTGQDAFKQIEQSIDAADKYILLLSYLVRDDQTGNRIVTALLHACERGVRVFVLFDELGSAELSEGFFADLVDAGAQVLAFSRRRRFLPGLRMNFRNHRKLVVIDGREAYLGGFNIGDEYIDGGEEFPDWRDTHARFAGDCLPALQLCFVEDWQFASKGKGMELARVIDWSCRTSDETRHTQSVTIAGLGPHLRMFSGDELYTALIEAAVERLWIATPYFVPDDRVISALKIAALRGVDVRILVPKESDHKIFVLLHQMFANELQDYNVKIFIYDQGFLHQKVMIVDRKLAALGSANFDNRSFRLNFELVAVISGEESMDKFEAMLAEDFADAVQLEKQDSVNWRQRMIKNTLHLLAPAV